MAKFKHKATKHQKRLVEKHVEKLNAGQLRISNAMFDAFPCR